MLKNWLKIYFYQIKNNKFFTALNILGLSIGIAGLIFSILYWNDEQSYNEWNPEKENVFATVTNMGEGKVWGSSSAAIGPVISSAVPEVESYCYTTSWYNEGLMEYNGKKIFVSKIIDSQKNFFDFFPYEFIKGNSKNALQDSESIALSESVAKDLFGKTDPINKQISYSGKIFTVKAIYKIRGKSSYQPLVVTRLIDEKLKPAQDDWGSFSFSLLLKLKNPDQAEIVAKKLTNLYFENSTKKFAKANNISVDEYIKQYGTAKITIEQLKTIRLHSIVEDFPEGRGNLQFLSIMAFLSVLILILSIFNYINLATANAIKRAKEVGVRKVIGASKLNIIKQFVFETIITTLFSIFLSLVIVELALPYYNNFLGKELIIYGNQFYVQLVMVFLFVILASGVFPAVYVSNFETLKVLKGNFSRSKGGIWLRNGMLILQFSIASFFIIGSYIVYDQVSFMSNKALGFNGEQVIDLYYRNPYDYNESEFKKKLYQKFNNVKAQLEDIDGVNQVSAGTFTFGSGWTFTTGFSYNDIEITGQNMALDFGMLEMLKVDIKEGRSFSDAFSSDTINSIIINESALKLMNEKNPIGKEIEWGGDKKLKIIGVVSDFHINGPQQKIPPMVFFHFKSVDWMLQNVHSIYLKVDPKKMESTMGKIEKLWAQKIDPGYPFKYDFVDKNFKRSYQNYVNQKNLFSLLNFVVILIALFGLFALASYSIQRKMKEIAIRKTLGAETKTLLKELSKQYIFFCVIGFLIASYPAYYLLDKWLENFAYRIEISVMPFVLGFFGLMILTLIVVLSRAYQATRVNVLKYLKYE